MKSIKHILLSIAMTISFSAIANDTSIDNDINEKCKAASNFAESVMEYRQEEKPMHVLMNELGSNPLFAHIIKRAYEYSALPTEDGKKRYIAKFGNQVYSECHKALSDKKSQDMVKKAI